MISADSKLPQSGSNIEAGGKSIGTIGSCQSNSGLAVMRIDRLASAIENGDEVSSEGIVLQTQLPEWTRLSLNKDQDS